ncbi:Protein tyrosine kinase/Protein kinase domain containing protein [Novymonas esmeraldas]|uniref:Protein tyrosine kinase/Protein kinase domain containing protein n=1 Tax=Novymonas esmeraldas TaxID=1808958 RepID=A0AAW0F1Z0_9TRYP
MLRGDYAGALAAYRGVADIADLEPGLLPASMRREAAASAVTGGAASVQVARLVRECEQRVRQRLTEPLCRPCGSRFGIDAVLKLTLPDTDGVREQRQVEREKKTVRFRSVVVSNASSAPSDMRQCAAARLRHVTLIEVEGHPERRVFGCSPCGIRDNFGAFWRLPQGPAHPAQRGPWSMRHVALGSAGALCSVVFFPMRSIPSIVTKRICDAPVGPMSDALRSAIPVCEATRREHKELDHLLTMWQSLTHPNLVPIVSYATCVEGGVALISECRPGCVMREVFARYPRVQGLIVELWGLGILSALAFLHERGLAHGSVSMDTVLIEADGSCRLKRFYPDLAIMLRLFRMRRTCYVSPLMATGALPTPACDMFCYGLLMLEAVTRQPPWRWAVGTDGTALGSPAELTALMKAGGQAFSDAVVAGRVVTNTNPLEVFRVENSIQQRAKEMVIRCVSTDAGSRPTAVEVRNLNKQLIASEGVTFEEDA